MRAGFDEELVLGLGSLSIVAELAFGVLDDEFLFEFFLFLSVGFIFGGISGHLGV